MDNIEKILELFTSLQNDENLDLSAYASQFVEVSEASETLMQEFADNTEASEANKAMIEQLKSENWDLSKKITTKETLNDTDTDDDEGEETEETDEGFENTDEAVESLFKKEKDDEK